MKPVLLKSLLLLCCLVITGAGARGVTLDEMYESIERHYPLIMAAQEKIGEKEARVLENEGAFDPFVSGTYDNRLGGYYDGGVLNTRITQPVPALGTELWAGYRVADGSFPDYQSGNSTLSGGEITAGLSISLLRNREIDERRAALMSSNLDLDASRLDLDITRLSIYRDAYIAYVRWLLAGRLLQTYETLLDVATERRSAIASTVEEGGLPEILLVENDQSILQRRALIVDAQRELDRAAQTLSMFFRSEAGSPLVPEYDPDLPLPRESESLYTSDTDVLVDQALSRRPDLVRANIELEQLTIHRELARNDFLPDLDLNIYSSRDLGSGPASLSGTDQVVGLSFNVPIRNRSAAGKFEANRHEVQSLVQEIRFLTDKTRTDLNSALLTLEATRTLESLAVEEMELAARLAVAEARRFEEGLSDYFILNARERSLAEAQLKRWQANLNHHLALADYYRVSMDDSVFRQEAVLEED